MSGEELDGANPGRDVVRAGKALLDAGKVGADDRSANVAIERLVALMQDRTAAAPVRRDAGHLLGRLGWEPEGGLDRWAEIPAGSFLYGEERHQAVIVRSYRIGFYPVTNKQYARFVEANGYERRECWSEEGWSWRAGMLHARAPAYLKGWLEKRPAEKRDRPFWWKGAHFGSPLCPVVGVSWFEAEAYCRWLALDAGRDPDGSDAPRLPTEEEWERAVRGTDGREYPWGDEWDRLRVNCVDWWAGLDADDPWEQWDSKEREKANPTPTAVATFPDGASPAGLWDGVGNVWEWGSPQLRTDQWYPLRGGSWYGDRRGTHCAVRNYNHPAVFHHSIGFRVVISAP